MVNTFLVIAFGICLTSFDWGELSPFPTAWSSATPNPISKPTAKPTPFPTPTVGVASYLRKQGGQTVRIAIGRGEDVAARVNAAGSALGARPGKIVVTGGGSIRTQMVVSHDIEFQGDYTCDTKDVWHGCIVLKDNVTVEGKNATIFEPTFREGAHPAIFVLQNYAGSQNVGGVSENITVKGLRIVGRQTLSDGGVRQAISLGNCHKCAVIDNRIENVASIGIQFGGSADLGNHAMNGIVTGNTIIGAAAAAIAVVNGSSMYVWNNTVLRPGRVGGPGGVSGVDIETNTPGDWAENLWVYNNLLDYREAAFNSVGSAILAQQRGSTRSGGLRIVNNRILASVPLGGLTSGIFFTGAFPGGIVANNYIQRAGQSCFQLYDARQTTFQDNEMVNCGGGGNPAVYLIGGGENIWRRNPIRYDEAIGGSASGDIWEVGSSGNKFDVATTKKAK